MKGTITIREYRIQDREKIIDLFKLNTPKYFSPEEEDDLRKYLENEIEHYYVIEVDGKVVGSGGINIAEDSATGKLSWDLIHPHYQGRGLGTILLKYRIERLEGFKNVQKITVRTSQLVYKFYEKADFKLIDKIEDYWAKGFDLYRMEYLKM